MGQVLGALFAVLVGLLILPTFGRHQQSANDNSRALATAQQQQQLYAAAQAYVQQNATTLMQTQPVGAANPKGVTVADLQNAGLLPNAFSAVNPYGQTWQVQVLRPTDENLQALVMSTGGATPLTDLQANRIASLVGAAGGFIPNNTTFYKANTVYGAYGGWTISTAGYTSVAGGHLAALLNYNSNQQTTGNYLYRDAVPNQPQLNRMNTALNMGNNNIYTSGGKIGVGMSSPEYNLDIKGNMRINADSSYNFIMNTPDSTDNHQYYNQIKFQSSGGDVWIIGNNPGYRFNLWDVRQGRNIFEVRSGGDLCLMPNWGNVQVGSKDRPGNLLAGGLISSTNNTTTTLNATKVNTKSLSATTATVSHLYTGGDGLDWALFSMDAYKNNGVGRENKIGSAYLNDIYLRSINKWASEIQGFIPSGNLCGSAIVSNGNMLRDPPYTYTGCMGLVPYATTCPSGYTGKAVFRFDNSEMWSCVKN